MKTDTQTSNENVAPNSRELSILKKYFPQCFAKPDTDEDGNIAKEHFDIEKLAEILQKDDVDIKKEGYALNFLGKSYAHYQANLDSETVIVPDEKNAETESENVYIVGDNLDALQHLKYSYAEKIKCIYIDPPYNTGKDDFVYNDKFGFTAKELEEKLDVSAEEAERIVAMNGKCTHSAWLTFMYPRLALARELLRDDGVIFISIDDNEQANLKLLCDEVFGEGNFVGELIIETATDNNPSQINIEHEYMICYAKNRPLLKNWSRKSEAAEQINEQYKKIKEKESDLEKIQEKLRKWIKDNKDELKQVAHYNNVDKDGVYSSSSNSSNPHPGGYMFDIPHPITHKNCPKPKNGWRWTEKTFWDAVEAGQVEWGKDHTTQPHIKKRIETATDSLKSIIYEDNRASTKLVSNLFNGIKVFDNPKPLNVLCRLIDFTTTDNSGGAPQYDVALGHSEGAAAAATEESRLQGDVSVAGKSPLPQHDGNCPLILDFFSGSGTTAHAVMNLNAKDGAKRKFILVQLDESVKKGSEAEKAGFRTIDEIGRERIRRAAAKIREENPLTAETLDLGFKTYYLKSMPKETLDKIKVFNPNDLISSDGDIVKSLGEATLLETWQIKDGFGFNATPQKIDLAGYGAYLFDDEKIGKYLYLLEEISEKAIKELVRKIEGFELAADKIFLYGYSFDFDALTSITTNLKTLKNRNPIEPIVRY